MMGLNFYDYTTVSSKKDQYAFQCSLPDSYVQPENQTLLGL